MIYTRGYKYELKVNNQEQTLLMKCAGISRFTWNWGLAERISRYQTQQGINRYTNAMKQNKILNRLKQTTCPWMYDVSKCIPQEALRDLDRAYKYFFTNLRQRRRKQTTRYVGLPRFKKKGRCKESFRLTGVIRVFPALKKVQLPRLGKLRLKERPKLSPTARILNATVSRTADRWYVALTVTDYLATPFLNEGPIIALDKGLSVFTALSNGINITKPKFLLKQNRKHRRLSKAYSRKKNGSKNEQKAKFCLTRFYRRITNQRVDFLHKFSTYLAKNHIVIVTENLHVKGLIKSKNLSKYWADLSHGVFQRFLEYKAPLYGSRVIKADRWFPSSKLCSNCLYYQSELTLSDRIFRCPLCGLVIDRDQNATCNLINYYVIYSPLLVGVAASSAETVNACEEVVSPVSEQVHLYEAGRTVPNPSWDPHA